jgi:hypothetical protein
VVQVSGGALTRTSSVAPSIKDKSQLFGEIGSTQFLERGFGPALFFWKNGFHRCSRPADMTAPASPIHRSFELAAERCEDLTPLVYERLLREYLETKSMFRTEGSELVKGSMPALTIDAILDSPTPTARFVPRIGTSEPARNCPQIRYSKGVPMRKFDPLKFIMVITLIGPVAAYAQSGGGSGGGSGGAASAGGASAGGASGAASTGAASGPTAGSASPAGSPNAGSAGAGTAGFSGVPSGPANAGGLNNSVNDPSGVGNAVKVPTAPGTNAAGTANSSGATSAGSALSGSGSTGSGTVGAASSGGAANNRAGTGGGRIDGVTNPGPEIPGDAAIKAENAKVDAKVKSICKGC